MAAWAEVIVAAINAAAVVITLYALVRSNRRLSASLRIGTLQQMVAEMNRVRDTRADHPDAERGMFESRRDWSDARIRQHMLAVELANIFEWAYLARREGLIDKDVWESWAETWRDVILASAPMRQSFTSAVWTFGRDPAISGPIREFVANQAPLPDPRRQAGHGRVARWADRFFNDE